MMMGNVTRSRIADIAQPIDYRSVTKPELLAPPAAQMLSAALSHRGVIYAEVPGWRPLRLDLHLPASSSDALCPVVIYVHGGSFVGGIREMGPWTTLPSRGIAVASISYRLAAETSFPEPVEDVRAAIRWIRRHAGAYLLDPDRISLWGSSAGALLSGIAAVSGETPLGHRIGDGDETTTVKSVISHYGLSDAYSLSADAIVSGETAASALEEIIGLFTAASPVWASVVAHITDGVRPKFLLVHGDADTRVGHAQSVRLHNDLLAADFESVLNIVPGAGHGSAEFADEIRIDSAVAFLHESWKE